MALPSKAVSNSKSHATVVVASSPTCSRAAEQFCMSLLNSSTTKTLLNLLQTLCFIVKSGLHTNLLILTKFTSTSASLNSLPLASSLLFSPLSSPHLYDSFLFNTLIRSSSPHLSVSSFLLMRRLQIPPNKFTFPFLLKSLSSLPNPLSIISQLHALSFKFLLSSDPFVLNTLIHLYSSHPLSLPSALLLFRSSPLTSTVTWSAISSGLLRCGRSHHALSLFRLMQLRGLPPDDVSLITALSACADLGALDLTRYLACFILRRGRSLPPSLPLSNALLDALAKCGDVDAARHLFDRMPARTVVSWTSIIDGLASHGRGTEAVSLFEEMRHAGFAPDDVALTSVLTACSHAGLVDKGRAYFASMREEFGIMPKIEQYGCMVDLLARAGLVEEALEFVRSMPMEANPVIWRTLIAACRVHGKHELGERITKYLLDKEPTHSSNYVLLSNVYALTKRWEKKMEIRKSMSKKGIEKVPGCSLLELDGEIYEFVAGDESHAQYKEIYEMAQEIRRELKRAGYVASTCEMLLDIDEEDKEDALHWHSEKLAIAFALLRTEPGTQIRIVKNLRVCGDCHVATKLISRVYGREIVVRDRSRFHRFKDGECSCKDFW